jgi:arylsulfatase A-like enzyme
MDRRGFIGASAATLAALTPGAVFARDPSPPNFIVVYVDDMGYGDIEPMGGKVIKTPNLNRMAREGVTLTDYHAPANLCTPSRAGMLTGRYPIRTGLGRGVIMQNDKRGLPLSEVTIAEALKPTYATALIGKWHLGHTGEAWPPTNHGFDLFYGIPYSHDMLPLALYEATARGMTHQPVVYPQLQQQFYTRAEKFIDDNREHPFFLALTLSAPHLPNYPSPQFAGKSAAGAYGDCVMEIDDIVGRLLRKLEATGLARNTFVIFTSDNGPWFEGSSGDLRQRKGGGGYEGAYRVPFIAWQPGTIPAGRRSDAIAMGIDIFPTLCAMAGVPLPKGVTIDGKDLSAVLKRNAPSPHDELLLFNDEDVVAIRTQRWSYVMADYFRNYYMALDSRGYPQLYDMSDVSESYSVASLHPDIARAMSLRLKRAREEFAPLRSAPKSDVMRMPPSFKEHVPDQWENFPIAD